MQILPFLFLCYFQLVQETESRNRYYVAPLVSDYEDLHNVFQSRSAFLSFLMPISDDVIHSLLVFAYCYEVPHGILL